ncbi:hypothetical protein PG994_006229 [Apiospora phragmitis]|uniref:Clr5 domain-containing protein n=1 Tax=Apiospora phragmitis TaxID=2905665 RepID=A0ABR1VEF8_9PEZI
MSFILESTIPNDIGSGHGQQYTYRTTITNSGITNHFTGTFDAHATQHWHSQDNVLFYQHPRVAHGAQNSLDSNNGVNRSEMALSAPYQPGTGGSQRSSGQDIMRSQACPVSRDWERFRDIMYSIYIKEGRSLKDLMESIDSKEAFVQYSRASLHELFGHSRREWKVGTVHFVTVQEPSITLTWSWQELFQLCESISVLSQSGVMSCLNYSLQQLLGAIGPSVILLDPNFIICFWKIAMTVRELDVRGVPEVDTYFYTIFGLYLECIRNSLSTFHPAHALVDFVTWLARRFRTFTQNREALSVRHQDTKRWLSTKGTFDARRKVFNEDLRWAYNQALRDKKSEKSFPVTSIEAEYHYYWCRMKDSDSQEGVLLQLDYLNAMSLRSQQYPETFAQGLWERLYAQCSAKKDMPQAQGMRLAFTAHVYTFVSVTNWLTKRSWRMKKPAGAPIFKTNMEKVINLLWWVEPEIEKLKIETLREGQVRQLTQIYTRIGCDHSQCGDNQCCMWAEHFSKMLVMWYKETSLSRRVMNSPPPLLNKKARQVLIQNCAGVKIVGKHSGSYGDVDTH